MKKRDYEVWVDEDLRAHLRAKLTGDLADHDAREGATRWRCRCGYEMPWQAKLQDGWSETLKFCGVCGHPRTLKPLDRSLDNTAIYRAHCRVSFDGDFQMIADGRRRGLWPKTRQINAMEQDREVGVLLEWDQVEELRDLLTRALRAKESPEKLIGACATRDKEDVD